jgi:hypothetical protein
MTGKQGSRWHGSLNRMAAFICKKGCRKCGKQMVF